MKKILITGAGGTVGLGLVCHFLSQNREVVAIDRSEDALAKLIDIKRYEGNGDNLSIEFGDILDELLLEKIVCKYDIEIIIHCAALKHVSTGFYYPEKLAFENIVAFSNIMQIVRRYDFIKKVILCSSDKAAKSMSTMGASKRFLEILGENSNISHAEFISIRFGNILHSNGSLTKVLEEKISTKKPITIRDKRMTRYILTIRDVINLTVFAIENGRQGDICSIETPSAKVIDIVTEFLSKKRADIPILYGKNSMNEAVHESLFNNTETNCVSKSGRFFVYNRDKAGDLIESDKEYLTTSNHSPIDSHSFSKIL